MSRNDSVDDPLENERSEEPEQASRRDAEETAQVQVKEWPDPSKKPG